jgi:F0F1-type ATP synthase assembly protein I
MFRPTLRVAATQLFLCVAVTGLAWALRGKPAAMSAAAGAVTALLATLILVVREKQTESHPDWGAGRNMVQLYRSGIERLVLIILLLGFAFAYSGAVPLAVLTGFLVAQTAWLTVLR